MAEKGNKQLSVNPQFPFRIALLGLEEEEISSRPHWHNFMELIYVVQNHMRLLVNGREFVLKEHDIAFLGKNTMHSTEMEKGQSSVVYSIHFDSSLLGITNANLLESRYMNSFLNVFDSKDSCRIICGEDNKMPDLSTVLSGMYREFTDQKTAYDLFIKGYLYQMIALLVRERSISVISEDYKQEHVKQVEKALKYIEENYNKEISLHKLAEECNISYHYFSKIFKKVTGKNYKEYLDHVRVTEAEKLLLTGKYSVGEAAYQVGVADQSCFYRLYKRVRGCSPTEFKAKMKYM